MQHSRRGLAWTLRRPGLHGWRRSRPSGIGGAENRTGLPMNLFAVASRRSRKLFVLLAAGLLASASPSLAADEPDAPKGAAVTVLTAAKSCFSSIVEATGIVIPREETAGRPDRPGLKGAEIMGEPGDSVTAGQVLARLTLP